MQELLNNKIQEMKAIMAAGLSKQEMLDAFKLMIEMIKKLKEEHNNSLSELDNKYKQIVDSVSSQLRHSDVYNSLVDSIKKDAVFGVEEMKNMTAKEIGRMATEHKDMLGGMGSRMEKMKQELMPDMNGLTNRAHNMLKGKMDKTMPMMMKECIVKMAGTIVKVLTDLPDKEKLQIKAINNLQEELDKLKKSIDEKIFTFAGLGGSVSGGSSGHITKRYSVSSQLNGVLKTFDLPNFYEIVDVKLSSVPTLEETTDYTVDQANSQITFTSEIGAAEDLASGQTCIVIYNS